MRTIPAFLFVLVLGLSAAAVAADASRRPTSISAQALGPALQSLAKERNIALVYRSELISGLTTAGASGQLTLDEALARLLEGTGLYFQYLNKTTVTVLPASSRATPATGVSSAAGATATAGMLRMAGADSAQAAPRTNNEARGEEPAGDDEVRVTGSRIRRDAAETGVSPVTVFTRKDIERSGAVTIVDFLGRITQSNSDVTTREIASFPSSGRATVNLRGLGNNTTLVLLNGRRLAKSGQGVGSDDYDLGGIALASVERIEVLTNSASALYGSDAIGGVVNIITRDHYNGLDVSL